jgi:predicted RecA/RadA family phage recombinase
MASYRHEGEKLDYTPASAVAAGDVVVLNSTLVTVADSAIAANTLGAVHSRGVFAMPKPTGAGTDYAQGSKVYYYNSQIVTGVTGTAAGFVAKKPATTDTTVDVLLWPGA